MQKNITCTINGKQYFLSVDVGQSLLDMLRDLGITSVKEGCGVGECGACTVLMDNIPVDSCITLAVWADGKAIRTVEGESRDGQLSRVQQAYVDAGAVQCGFCAEKHKDRKVPREEIRKGHAGNLCRCTGYETIIRAVEMCLEDSEDRDPDKD